MSSNYERIKAMSIEQMAHELSDLADVYDCPVHKITGCTCEKSCMKMVMAWLESEADDGRV